MILIRKFWREDITHSTATKICSSAHNRSYNKNYN